MSISPELFRDAFIAAFKINRRLIKFDTNRQRTSHMVSHIYRTIADYLDLSVDYEYQSIDTRGNLDVWDPVPPTKGGHRYGEFTVH
jgi:hypothetical protein